MTLTEFLLARIAEDEAAALTAVGYESRVYWEAVARDLHLRPQSLGHYMRHHPDRVLAECGTKRGIVDRYLSYGYEINWDDKACGGHHELESVVLPLLALPYADHPDYDESWRP